MLENYSEINDIKLIFYHEPHVVQTIGYLHPLASLFTGIPDFTKIHKAYESLKTIFKKYNIHYCEVTDVLRRDRKKLVKLALESCKYIPSQELIDEKNPTITEQYKNSVLEKLDVETLLSLIFSRPEVHLKKQDLNTFIAIDKITINPLSNLVFIKDLQILTSKGLILANTGTYARKYQGQVIKTCFQIIKAKIVGEIPQDCFIEGGDFMVVKPDLALFHIGVRSNFEAAKYLMDFDLLGVKRFAVINNEKDNCSTREFLDMIFNIVDEKNVLLLDFDDEEIPKEARRTVDLYVQREDNKAYELKESFYDFREFLEKEFKVITISAADQRKYQLNFLHLGKIEDKNVIVTANHNLKDLLQKNGVEAIVQFVEEFQQLNKLHGSFHCTTQAFRY